jgi:hypothetical protein
MNTLIRLLVLALLSVAGCGRSEKNPVALRQSAIDGDTEALAQLIGLAKAGDADAQFYLGYMYSFGESVPTDLAQAVVWYQKAAEQGHIHGQFSLGLMYDTGGGVPKDPARAAIWYRKAAEQGFAKAQTNLGLLYANGDGVPKDLALSYMWLNLAAAQGNALAKHEREALEKRMTSEQISEAQKLSRDWKPRK